MTEGLSSTGRFRYFWKGDEYYIVDLQTGKEFHLGLILNYQVATEIALNTCRVLESLVAYNPADWTARNRLLEAMGEIYAALPCPNVCTGCNMEGRSSDELNSWYLACYLKSRISIISGQS